MKIQNQTGTENNLDIAHKKTFTKISKLILAYQTNVLTEANHAYNQSKLTTVRNQPQLLQE